MKPLIMALTLAAVLALPASSAQAGRWRRCGGGGYGGQAYYPQAYYPTAGYTGGAGYPGYVAAYPASGYAAYRTTYYRRPPFGYPVYQPSYFYGYPIYGYGYGYYGPGW